LSTYWLFRLLEWKPTAEEVKKMANQLRGRFLEAAIDEMRRTGVNEVTLKCPCCGERVTIRMDYQG